MIQTQDPQMFQMLTLSEKNFKMAVINMTRNKREKMNNLDEKTENFTNALKSVI